MYLDESRAGLASYLGYIGILAIPVAINYRDRRVCLSMPAILQQNWGGSVTGRGRGEFIYHETHIAHLK